MADDGFHEVQLSGKHLVALFIGAAIVLVVTFLCGVLVGRGVRTQKEAVVAADALAAPAQGGADPTAAVTATQPVSKGPSVTPAATPPAAAPPTPPDDDLSYYTRLDSTAAPAEDAKGGVKLADAKKPAEAKPLPPPPPETPANGEAGWQLKAAAYKDKAQADALAAKLSGKGYGTFVIQLPSGKGAGLYSVRVGKFKTRKEAEAAKRRLEKEEQLKPLLTSR
jgi:cell division protein FtsN